MVYISPARSQPPCWPCCNATHDYIVKIARELSAQLIREGEKTRYNAHGLFGIFANGDAIDFNVTGRTRMKDQMPWLLNYHNAKTRFMFSRLCALAQQRQISTICEIGFNAGLSAMLLLETVRSARVLSYDLGDFRWARRADELVVAAYGRARFPGVRFGDSTSILRAQKQADPAFKCDAAFIDGSKKYDGRMQHLLDIRSVATSGVPVFLDEITSMRCINGSIPDVAQHRAECYALNEGYWESTRAYTNAVRSGLLRIVECTWPPRGLQDRDGICLAELL